MATTPPQSFLHGLFPQAVASEQRELHRLRLENVSLKARLATTQATLRSSEDTTRKMLSSIEIITARAWANISKTIPISTTGSQVSEHAVYVIAATLRPDSPSLDVLAGRQLITHVIALMASHFFVMVDHAEYTFAPAEGLDAQQKEHLLRVVLANLICWVFGVQVPDWEQFIAPKQGMTLREEISHTIKACMSLRAFEATHNKFPVELMFTFILNWNAFAVEQIGVHPLPLDPKLGLSMAMTPIVFKNNIDCECAVYRKKSHTGETITLRMYPLDKTQSSHPKYHHLAAPHKMPLRLLRNSPGTYAVAAARSLIAPHPPSIGMPPPHPSPPLSSSPSARSASASAAAASSSSSPVADQKSISPTAH